MMQTKLLTMMAVTLAIIALPAATAMADLAPGVTLDFNANDPASGVSSSAWNSLTADQSRNWSPGGDVTLVDASGGTSLSKAYRFTGGAGATASSWDKYNEQADTTWELWVKPAGTGADNNQVIFETGGGGDGMAIWYDKGAGTINCIIDDGGVQATVSSGIDIADFRHVVIVYDKDYSGSDDMMQLYVDGALVDELTTSGLDDWAGGDGATLGSNAGIANNMTGGKFNGDLSILRFWENKALTAAEVTGNFDLFAGASVTVIYPENGAVVPPGDVILEWENYDDPCSNDPVYAEAWWGTDPNRYTGSYTLAGSGNDITTATITPAGPGVYYWYVDNTITIAGSDPCTLEGRVYMFTNDGPIASVNAGPDMVTWEGEPVGLIADVNDDGGSPLTYSWSADLPSGVTAVFNPSADVADTAVTFTRAPYTNANIVNAGFEAEQLDEDGWGSAPGWTAIGRKGSWNPPADSYTDSAVPEGIMCGWAEKDGNGLAQVLAETLAADTQYVLTVEVGNSLRYDWTGYKVQLLAGGTVIAEDKSTLTPAVGTFETSTVTYTYDAVADANKVGLPLEIRMLSGSLVPEGVYAECNFDDVKLTADPGFPVPAGASSIDVTLTVKDEINPVVYDTMTIEVYNDTCQASRVGKGNDYDTDYIQNCLIDVEDLRVMAEAWLNDTSATAAMENPTQPDGSLVVNGNFAMYKPGTDIPVVSWGGSGYNIWSNTIGYSRPLSGTANDGTPGYVTFADGDTGTVIDTPGWETPVAFGGAAATKACDLFSSGYDGSDGTSTLNAFGAWSSQNGTLAQSAEPIVLPVRGTAGALYTLKAMSLGDPEPKTFSLVVDGVEITPASSVNPVDTGTWQEISRTYSSSSIPAEGDVKILVGTKRPDETVGNPALTGSRWRVDNIALDYEITDPAAPSVDAGPDMVTWLGEPVTMAPIVTVDDPNIANPVLTYNWTAAAPEWLDVAISDPAVEAPEVTVTRVTPYWWEIPIKDSSFEKYTMSPDGQVKWLYSNQTPWRFPDQDGTAQTTDNNKGYFGQLFLWNPKPGNEQANWNKAGFDGIVPDGDNCVVVGSILRWDGQEGGSTEDARSYTGGLAKLLVSDSDHGDGNVYPTYDPGYSYNLTTYIGHSGLNYTMYGGYKVELLAGGTNVDSSSQYTDKVVGGTVIGSVESTDPIDPNTWIQVTVPVGPNAANADLAGEPLQIRITSLKIPDDPNTTYVIVDNVKLMTDAPPALTPVKMKLSVKSEGSAATVTDVMKIDVYETPCDVTKLVIPETIDQTDHVLDCITNLMDFAVIAKDWLLDYDLKAAEPK